MRINPAESAEFLTRGGVPFALAACERLAPQPVTGHYDEIGQVWQGLEEPASLTVKLTATPGDSDSVTD